ncbi:hypothetical protein [Pararobbsia alpina]|uniref:Uncharacterized protein n=1 Tax=Pararobbsia alpina TaxID=621374 RepID=A0A6S7ASE3_9BURK|nr:hypothetical protein [Pararobbsia alpina]CAB3776264.1 hypothetical protein LMG28138_00115 [Pararobbsia alpina]
MSPLLNSHQLWLFRGHVALETTSWFCRGPRTSSSAITEIGNDALAAVDALLAAAPRSRFPYEPLAIHASSPWLQQTIVPWQPALILEADWLAWAALLAEDQGLCFTDPLLALETAHFAAPRLCVLMERTVVHDLRRRAAARKLRVWRIDSSLVHHTNEHRCTIVEPGAAVCLVEPDTLSIGLRLAHDWHGILSFPGRCEELTPALVQARLRETAILTGSPMPENYYRIEKTVGVADSSVAFHALAPQDAMA